MDNKVDITQRNLDLFCSHDLQKETSPTKVLALHRPSGRLELKESSDLDQYSTKLTVLLPIVENLWKKFDQVQGQKKATLKANLLFINSQFEEYKKLYPYALFLSQQNSLGLDTRTTALQFYPQAFLSEIKESIVEISLPPKKRTIKGMIDCLNKDTHSMQLLGLYNENLILSFLDLCLSSPIPLKKFNFSGLVMTDKIFESLSKFNHFNTLILGDCSGITGWTPALTTLCNKLAQADPKKVITVINKCPNIHESSFVMKDSCLREISDKLSQQAATYQDLTLFNTAAEIAKCVSHLQHLTQGILEVALNYAKVNWDAASSLIHQLIPITHKGTTSQRYKRIVFAQITSSLIRFTTNNCKNQPSIALKIKELEDTFLKEVYSMDLAAISTEEDKKKFLDVAKSFL